MVADERDLVVELDAVHTVTGHRFDDQIETFGGALVRTVSVWEYRCTCGELRGGHQADEAMRHIAEVRGRGAFPPAVTGGTSPITSDAGGPAAPSFVTAE